MDGATIFIAIGGGIIALALVVGRLFRKTVRKPMPGSHPANNATFWYGAGDGPDGGSGSGDGGGGGGGN